MSLSLRIFLIVGALCALAFVGRKIRKAQLKLIDGFTWFIFAVLLLLMSLFPDIVYFFARLVGIISPANLVFAVLIAVLLLIVFVQSIRISQAEVKIGELAEEVALRDERYNNLVQGDAAKNETDAGEKRQDVKSPTDLTDQNGNDSRCGRGK